MQIKVWIETSKIGSRCVSTIEIPDESLEGLEGEERDAEIDELAREEAFSMMSWSWESID